MTSPDPEDRCVVCDCPLTDHVPPGYVIWCWFKHRILQGHMHIRGRQ